MSIISLGIIDKKLYLIIFIMIVILINVPVYNIYYEYICFSLSDLEDELSCIIVGIIIRFIFKLSREKGEKRKKSVKSFIILFILKSIKISFDCLYYEIVLDPKYFYDEILNTINGFEIFLVSLATFLLLKYKYYVHHLIFMVVFCVLGICNDIILDNFSKLEYDYLFIYIIYIINEVLLYSYFKYMLDILFYHYIELLIINGIFGFIIKFIIYLGLIINEYQNDNASLIPSLVYYFKETNTFSIIFFHFFYLLLENGIYMLLTLLILYNLKPNHMIIADEINFYSGIVIFKIDSKKYYTLIPFAFQMISLLFYLEIFELNVMGLNKNTTKNIQIREKKERARSKSFSSEIELEEQNALENLQLNETLEEENVSADYLDMIY